jgi:hypothetical protein
MDLTQLIAILGMGVAMVAVIWWSISRSPTQRQ